MPPFEDQPRLARIYRNLVVLQSDRLQHTYEDFLRSERFQVLTTFFFEDVYSTDDKTERNSQFERLYDTFRRKLGEGLTRGIGELVALNRLSDELDVRVVEVLGGIVKNSAFDLAQYEEAYRRCDNYDVRVRQIETLARSIRYFRGLAEWRTIGWVLRSVTAVAKLFGGGTVVGFLERGYRAYRSVTTEEAEEFVRAVHDREWSRLDRIYGKS